MQQRIEAEREALEIFERTRPLDTLGVLYTCKNHVGSLYEVERGAEAGPYLARWLELRPYVFADGSDEDEAAEESAGLYQVIAGDLPAARKRFARCAAIFGDGLWKRTDDAIALYWLHLSQLQQQEGNLDSALTSASRAEAIFRARYKTAPAPFLGRQWGATLDRVGQMYAFQDSLAAAETAFSVSAALHAQHRSPAHPDFARLEAEIAGVRLRMGEWDSAAAPALLAAEALTTHVRHEFARMTEDEALRYRGHGAAAALNVLLSIVCAKPDSSIVRETWKQVVRDAGLVAAETALRRRLLSSTRDSLLASWTRELVTLQARLGELELRGGHSAIADSLAARANVLEQRLAERSGRFASDFASLDASAKAIASTLPADARLVHVVRFLRSGPGVPGLAAGSRSVPPSDLRVGGPALLWYGAFVVAPGAITPAFISLGPAREIEPAADRWQRALAAGTPPTAGAIRAAKALRRRVWDPIAALVPGARLVLWVPDGTLATLPMATLPAQDGTPLLEQGPTLHILGSPRELLAHRLTPEGTRALLVGGADYGARVAAAAGVTGALPAFRGRSRDCEELAPPRYASLPGSRAEVEDVARAWSSRHDRTSDVLTGALASEAEVRARIAGCGLVHLATHGYLVPDSCARNRLSERLLVADLRDIPQPPGAGGAMLRSGLVFAGANVNGADPGNDGLLTAADIAMLDLSSARLVTLSACESGSGRVVASEGVIGLRWALEQAGAGVTLTACHRVSDETTSRWMDDFYAAWLRDGLSAPEAARRASRQLRKELRARTGVDDPGAWGAFVTAGDWR
jgi:CHAT domain-containing protein/tetratricopeptide (TPR) repeat protein